MKTNSHCIDGGFIDGGFDFDTIIDRTGTQSEKWTGRRERFGSDDVLPLWLADMDFAAPPAVTQALLARAAHPVYGYTVADERVLDSLAGWLAARYDWQPSQMLLVPGVMASLAMCVEAFTAPGDAVIVQPPVYPALARTVQRLGRRVLENPLSVDKDGRYQMDMPHLAGLLGKEAGMLLLCSPHNPLGRVWRSDELRAVLDLARDRGWLVFSDEIHADMLYPGEQHTPLAQIAGPDDRVVTALGPGKAFSMPGLGLSALVVTQAASYATLRQCLGRPALYNPFSLVAFEAAYRYGAEWLGALMQYLRDSRDMLIQHLAAREPRIRPLLPQAGMLVWLDCRALGVPDEQLSAWFVEQFGWGLSSGSQFGAGGSGFMRLNLATPRARWLAG